MPSKYIQNQSRDDYQTKQNTDTQNKKYAYCLVKYKGWQQANQKPTYDTDKFIERLMTNHKVFLTLKWQDLTATDFCHFLLKIACKEKCP